MPTAYMPKDSKLHSSLSKEIVNREPDVNNLLDPGDSRMLDWQPQLQFGF
jgi:hypothetical protein